MVHFTSTNVKVELDSENIEKNLLAFDGLRALSYFIACVLLTGYVQKDQN